MPSYIADRFGNSLTKYDIQNLKREIIRPFLKHSETILPRSRKKVLELAYSIDSVKTLEYLIKKSDNDLREALGRYRDLVLTKGLNTPSAETAVEMLGKFEETDKKYSSLVRDLDFQDVLPSSPKINILRERVKGLTVKAPSTDKEQKL